MRLHIENKAEKSGREETEKFQNLLEERNLKTGRRNAEGSRERSLKQVTGDSGESYHREEKSREFQGRSVNTGR